MLIINAEPKISGELGFGNERNVRGKREGFGWGNVSVESSQGGAKVTNWTFQKKING